MGSRDFHLKCFLLASFLIISGMTNTQSQSLSRDDIQLYEDIVYSTPGGQELRLDIAVPKALNSPAPVIVDIPGGAWRIVNKSADDAVYYARYGFIGVSITHRTSDIAVFPAVVHDCKTAIRWLRAHAEEYRINPDKIGVTGFSSGGHLAVLLGTSAGDAYLEGEGEYLEFSSRVQAVVDHFGPTDFLQMNDTTGLGLVDAMDHFAADSPESLFLGGPLKEKVDLAQLANPIHYIDPDDPPVLIGHGEKDGMVIIRQSELLFDALKRAGVSAKFIRVKNAGHMYRPFRWDVDVSPSIAEINRFTIAWFQKWLGKPDISSAGIKAVESFEKLEEGVQTPLFYRLTVDLPGKNKDSYCRGRFLIKCEDVILTRGEIELFDLSTDEKRIFNQDVLLTGSILNDKEILWNFRGEIYDSKLDEKFEPMFMQGVTFDDSIQGIGFDIRIKDDGSFKIEKRVYRK